MHFTSLRLPVRCLWALLVCCCVGGLRAQEGGEPPNYGLRIVPDAIRFRLAANLLVECPLQTTGSHVFWRANAVDLIARYSIKLDETIRLLDSASSQSELRAQLRRFRSSRRSRRRARPQRPQSAAAGGGDGRLLVCTLMDQRRTEYGNITLQLATADDQPQFSRHLSRFFEADRPTAAEQAGDDEDDGPVLLAQRLPASLQRKLGEQLKLSCLARGEPRPRVVWLKDGRLLGEQDHRYQLRGGRLLVKRLQPEDLGNFTCLAYNRLGQANSTCRLQITGK